MPCTMVRALVRIRPHEYNRPVVVPLDDQWPGQMDELGVPYQDAYETSGRVHSVSRSSYPPTSGA